MSETDPRQALSQLIFGHLPARAVHAAAELGLADAIADGVTSEAALAERVSARPDIFRRFMRYLVALDIFARTGDGYALTPMSELLRRDAEGSQLPAARLSARTYGAWIEIFHTLRTGEAGYAKFYGKPLFDHVGEDPEVAAVFDAAMTAIHGPETAAMLDAYDFSEPGTVMDVGGGNGSLLMETLRRYPDMQGIVFDLPHVVERTSCEIRAAGLESRCRAVGGNFFESVSERADTIILRHIIHDWTDSESIRILKNCAEALPPGGRILVVEMIVPEHDGPSMAKRFDLSMMLLTGGSERTEAEYRALFQAAGLTLAEITPTDSPVSVIEARPAT